MEHLPAQDSGHIRAVTVQQSHLLGTIGPVAKHGMPYMGQMDPYLMCSSGNDPNPK
jgi:hypothetical protein